MSSEDKGLVLLGIILPFVAFFLAGSLIRRHERYLSDFYWALRETFPRKYVKQNKLIKFVRKRLGLETKNSIHWLICLFHYFQIVMVVSPIFTSFLYLFIPVGNAIVISYVIGLGPYGVISIMDDILMLIQVQRCKKIKKTNSIYSGRDFKGTWRGHI